MKYYFGCLEETAYGQTPSLQNFTSDKHPAVILGEFNAMDEKRQYVLTFYAQIDEATYNAIKDDY